MGLEDNEDITNLRNDQKIMLLQKKFWARLENALNGIWSNGNLMLREKIKDIETSRELFSLVEEFLKELENSTQKKSSQNVPDMRYAESNATKIDSCMMRLLTIEDKINTQRVIGITQEWLSLCRERAELLVEITTYWLEDALYSLQDDENTANRSWYITKAHSLLFRWYTSIVEALRDYREAYLVVTSDDDYKDIPYIPINSDSFSKILSEFFNFIAKIRWIYWQWFVDSIWLTELEDTIIALGDQDE